MINLDEIAKNDKQNFGELKLTVAQFFRINGGTTQMLGVTPDILLPTGADAESFGESSYDNALPWVQVKAAGYLPAGDLGVLLPSLRARHEARVKNDKDFQNLKDDIAEFRLQRKKNHVSLNEAERRKERDVQEAKLTAREARRDSGKAVQAGDVGQEAAPGKSRAFRDDGLQTEERALAYELAAEKVGKNAKDVVLNEAVHILSDEAGLLKPGARLAARNKSASSLNPDQRQGAEAVRAGTW
jgi:carboxyl-terminal processing protease